jgi:hypothetical protein
VDGGALSNGATILSAARTACGRDVIVCSTVDSVWNASHMT